MLLYYPRGKTDTAYTVPNGVTELGDRSFGKFSALEKVTLPSGLKTIKSVVFHACPNFAMLVLPDLLESIGNSFLCNTKVSSIVIPENIEKLKWNSLSECPELTSVDHPSTLTSIGGYVFKDDPRLETVICRAAYPPTLDGSAFSGNTNPADITLKVPAASVGDYQAADGWKGFDVVAID